jgi:hypothetical protein
MHPQIILSFEGCDADQETSMIYGSIQPRDVNTGTKYVKKINVINSNCSILNLSLFEFTLSYEGHMKR